MKFQHETAPPGRAAIQLWLMLPGAYMKPADFLAAGFVDAVRQRGLPHDIALLEANIAEVADGSALRFLQAFLREQPAQGRRVCLLGISLGAHLAMACLALGASDPRQAPAADRVAGACLLAPYLGPREIAAQVEAAGSLQQWRPDFAQDDVDGCIWRWLQRRPAEGRDLYLGYGSEDRFARAHSLMAQAFPADRVDVQPGGHVWAVWTNLWCRHLDRVYGH